MWKTTRTPPNKIVPPPEIETKLTQNANKKSEFLDLKYAAEKTIEKYPEEWTHVYTDGSAEEATKNAGWGVWIKSPDGRTEELFNACGANSTNYDAEVLAIQNAIDHLHQKFENSTPATDVVIFTDAKSALQAMEGGELDEALQQVANRVEKFRSTYLIRLKLQWIPGHTGIFGNERADILAKKGSKLTQPTKPTTLNAAKQQIKQTYKREWMNNWASGDTGRKVYAHMKKTTSKDQLKELKRKDQSAIFRLRTQHIPLNFHRNRINPEIPPNC